MKTLESTKSKSQISLSKEESISLALRQIFLSLWDTTCINESGVKKDTDSEYLHDYRVAVRRTRSLLGQTKKIIPPDIRRAFNDEFSWLSTRAGLARDYDVMLQRFAEYQAMLPDCHPTDVKALRNYLQQQRNQAYTSLIEALQSNRYDELKKNWTDFLESDDVANWKSSKQTIGTFAIKRITRIYKLVLSEGSTIGPASPVEAFHQLRKSCKKFRYLLEMFRSFYPDNKIMELIKELKKLQDDLGELQDLEAHTEILHNFFTLENSNKDDNHELKNVIQQLSDKMRTRKRKIMKNFNDKFDLFASKKVKKLYKDLLEE